MMKNNIVLISGFIACALFGIVGCSNENNSVTGEHVLRAYLAKDKGAYERLKLKRGTVETWEDSMRTTGGKGTYEWWYFDTHLEDGSTMVVVFYTKPIVSMASALDPWVTLNIDYPDGRSIKETIQGDPAGFSSSKETCDVRMGKNYFRGDLKNYEIHVEKKNYFDVNIKVAREAESWRPETGHTYYGNKGDYGAWVVAVPQGDARVDYTYKGKRIKTGGSCYHDHNWGNKNMIEVINHWYWSRAQVGPYSIIASEVITEKDYGTRSLMFYHLSKDGKTVVDDGSKVKMLRSFARVQPQTGKPLSDELLFIYEDDTSTYELSLIKSRTILNTYIIKDPFKRILARIFKSFNGAYYRMVGNATLKVYHKGKRIETYSNNKAVWELMHFGK